ncbi:methyltransferase domain protein, partial [Necator americanus]
NNHQYACREYWNERFLEEEQFEWLADFDAFKHLVLPHLKLDSRILHVGCGSSQMSVQLYNMGYKNITNVDYSEVLVDSRRSSFPNMKWICDDIRSLASIPSGSFDVVIEKATLEALLVTEKSPWNPSDVALETIDSVFESIARVLTGDGIFISISFTQPHFRVPALLRQEKWSVSVEEFGEFFHYFVYVMHCRLQTSREVKDRFASIAPDWSRKIKAAK